MLKDKIFTVVIGVAVIGALGYGVYLREPQLVSWIQGTGSAKSEAKAPEIPAEPTGEEASVKTIYADAIVKHDARLKDPNYIAYMAEGLEWKSVGDYAKTNRNAYYAYAAYVYTEAGKKFPDQWVPWYNVGNMFNLIGEYGRAEQAYKKSIAIDPTRNESFAALVDMLYYRHVKPTDDIIGELGTAFRKITQDQPFAALAYARYLLTYQKNQEALEVFTIARDNAPSDSRFPKEIEVLQKIMRGESLDAPSSGNAVIRLQ